MTRQKSLLIEGLILGLIPGHMLIDEPTLIWENSQILGTQVAHLV